MKRSLALAALTLLAATGLSGCGNATDTINTETTPVTVYDTLTEASQSSANGLNANSADTVATAAANDVFTYDGSTFTNNAGGYTISVPNGLDVVDMGDATYRSTLANDNMRLEIFTQTLGDDVGADTYLNYSNRFLENTWDFTITYDKAIDDTLGGQATHYLTWERRALARVDNDRNYYGLVDIVQGKNVYCFLLTSTEPISADTLRALAASFESFTPTVEAKEYPRQPRQRDDLTAETQAFYDRIFSDDADLTWGLFEPSVSGESTRGLLDVQKELSHRFEIVLCYSNIYENYTENNIYNTLNRLWEENGSVVELTLQTQLYDPLTQNNMVYDILDGKYDDFLHAYAADVARFGHPVLFRPFNEMNGDWCNYSAYWTARDCSTYVELYRYIYSIFEEEGANKNTLWVWNPNEKSFPAFAWNNGDNYYPGDEYVDIVGLTGYNTGDYYDGETWRTFDEIYDPVYAQMAPQYEQPLMITEFACSSYGGDKAAWVEDMFEQLENYPRIKAAVWWDSADKDAQGNIARAYYIDNDQGALKIFKEHLYQDDYKENPRERTAALLKPYNINA